jgi:fucose permease
MVNWLHAAFGVGAATGPLIMAGVLSAGNSWRVGYAIVGVAQLLLAAAFATTRGRWRDHDTETPTAPTPTAPMSGTLALPSAWLSILLFFLYSGLEMTAGQWLYSLLTEARGLLPALAGVAVSAYWGSLTVGRMVAGAIVARVPVRTLLRLCMGGAILGVLLLWLDIAPWLSLAGIALLGVSLAPMYPSFITLTPARMGPAHTANTVGFQVAGAMLGGSSASSASSPAAPASKRSAPSCWVPRCSSF